MIIGKDATARNLSPRSTSPGPLGSSGEGGADPEARKRRVLRRCKAVVGASPSTQTALLDSSSVARIPKGRALLSQGEPAVALNFVGMGRLRIRRAGQDGRTLSLGYRGPGDVLGEACLGALPAHRETALATEDVEVVTISLSSLRPLLSSDLAFASGLVATVLERQFDTEERLASLLFRNVEGRLADFLLKAAVRWGVPDPRGLLIAASFTHQELAAMIGSTRETVTLTLGDLRRKGVIELDRRRIVVLDREALRARL